MKPLNYKRLLGKNLVAVSFFQNYIAHTTHTHMHTCVHKFTHTPTHTHISVLAHAHTYTPTHTHTHTHTRTPPTHVCAHTHTQMVAVWNRNYNNSGYHIISGYMPNCTKSP